ncbi:alginate lyase family protein [uncultured Polaribacter sp.]|uniref:alginate lyase family protein n=1 Tax=uncultured Polaribacter sp. TaxID=174711 RepID=UPI0026117132|nr:alginate lyase family protein [uncultured Polaribacter sp.]
MIKNIIVLFLIICFSNCNSHQEITGKIRVIEYQELENQKNLIKKGNKKAVNNYNKLLKEADTILEVPFFSVVHKTGVPPSGNKHDYMSIGPYWWPNPNSENGLPYIRKDGEINPETRNNATDYVEKNNFISAVKTLTKAYYYSDDKKYADKGMQLIKAWFLDDATKMNPNVNYGQYVPGQSEGRCFGILEFKGIESVLKFLELTKEQKILDKKIEKGMLNWLTEYANWLQKSKLGKKEVTRENNHGTYYDIQLLNILLYLNRIEEVKEYLTTITTARIFQQIEPDGSQPKELARTKSYSYTVMNLSGFLELVKLGRKVGVNLWNLASEDGRSIKKGYQYMLPYLTQEKEWKLPQIVDKKHSEDKLISDLKYIKRELNDNSFDKALDLIKNK